MLRALRSAWAACKLCLKTKCIGLRVWLSGRASVQKPPREERGTWMGLQLLSRSQQRG